MGVLECQYRKRALQGCLLCYIAVPFCRGSPLALPVNLIVAHDATLNSYTNQPGRRSSPGHKSAKRLQACTLATGYRLLVPYV